MLQNPKDIKSFIKGFQVLFLVFIALGLVAICRIIWLQQFCDEILKAGDTIVTEIIPPSRGKILSHDGKPLAVTIQEYKLYWDAAELPKEDEEVFTSGCRKLADSLASLYHKPASYFVEFLKKGRKSEKRYILVDHQNISYQDVARAKRFPIFSHRSGGLIVKEVEVRKYPYKNMARKVIGSINANMEGSGLEKSFNYKLKGSPGARLCYRVAGVRNTPVSNDGYLAPIDGIDIRSTLDVTIQEAAENALMEQLQKEESIEGGTIVVMEVKTGAIRAMANLKREDGKNLTECYNYATMHATEPGSTLKLSSLLAMLEDNHITLSSKVDGSNGLWSYKGIPIRDSHKGTGVVTALEAFEKSSNVCFAKMTVNAYQDHPEKYLSRINDLKLGERFGLEIDEEASATIHYPGDPGWSDVTLAMMGFGYGILITPLHTLALYNAVANDGKMMKPYLVEAYCKDGEDIQIFSPKVMSSSICSKRTIDAAKMALRAVVDDGTARNCKDPRYSISGKTGTAQIALPEGGYVDSRGCKKYQASFAGYYPSEDPHYSCIVVLYSGRTQHNFYGSTWAAPVFKNVADKIYAASTDWKDPLIAEGNRHSPDNPPIASGRSHEGEICLSSLPVKDKATCDRTGWVTASTNGTSQSDRVPDVVNMGLRDAICLLENKGYKVSFKGSGRVCAQNPASGTELGRNGAVEIILGKTIVTKTEHETE